MASCGASLLDDNKETIISDDDKEEFDIDHSLKNVVAFSVTKKQMCLAIRQEGLLKVDPNGNEIDRRVKVDYDNEQYGSRESYRILYQLTAQVGGKKMVGTSFKILINIKAHILTCGHNLVGWNNFEGKIVNHKNVWAYEMRQDENSWTECRNVNTAGVRFHPKLNGSSPDSGFDIAVGRLGKRVGKRNSVSKKPAIVDDVQTSFCNPELLRDGMTIEVPGYPGEKDGCPHTHEGTIVRVTKTRAGGWILMHNVDCTCGNYGSPIMITDKRYLEAANTPPWVEKVVIGVHTGHGTISGFNFGTLITPSAVRWVYGHNEGDQLIDDAPKKDSPAKQKEDGQKEDQLQKDSPAEEESAQC